MTLIIFLLILSLLIIVHEFGHFIVAKLSGVKVEEFGIGFPPRIISLKRGETVYSINALVFGGFVKLYGEDKEVTKDVDRSFSNRSKKLRATIITAGVVMNFLLAVVGFSLFYGIIGIPRQTDQVRVVGVIAGSPSEKAGLKLDDVILSVDGNNVSSTKQFIQLIETRRGKEVAVTVSGKDRQQKEIKVIPRESPPPNEGPLGVAISNSEQYFPPLWQRPFWGTVYGFQEALLWGKQTINGLGITLSSLFVKKELPEGVAGPVGIYKITGEVCRDFLSCLSFVSILSVNLAILNILPIPPIDGGKLFFVGVEAVLRGKARAGRAKFEQISMIIGLGLVLALLVSTTIQDLKRIFD